MKHAAAVILAAGEGKRLKASVPKVLRLVCGRPMIEYVLRAIREAGVEDTAAVLGANEPIVKPALPKDIRTVLQPKVLGTADAVGRTRRLFRNAHDLLVLCGDAPLITGSAIRQLLRVHRRSGAAVTLLTAHRHPPKDYGRVVRDASGLVIRIVEEKEASAAELGITEVNSGAYCFDREQLFKVLPQIRPSAKTGELYLTEVIQLLRRRGARLEAFLVADSDEILGVNHPHDLVLANRVLRQRVIDRLWNHGVMIADPSTTYIDEGVEIGSGTAIEPHTVIETGVRIGMRCRIGPFCHVRTGTEVGDDVVLGSFVEVSRSRIGRGSRALHMTYLGNATVEEAVTIGAGTVASHADGAAARGATIRRGASIGDGTVLVAPTVVGAGAVTEAGSVVGAPRSSAWRRTRA